jgi:hypothetical protein
MLNFPSEVGGPEEDRTPDLLIANDTLILDINDLPHCSVVRNRGETGGECTNRAQSHQYCFGPVSRRTTSKPQWRPGSNRHTLAEQQFRHGVAP